MIFFNFLFFRLKCRLSGWFFWVLIWLALGLLFSTVFNSISKDAKAMEEIINTIPPAISRSFNIGTGYLTRVENFLSGQFLTFYTLIGSVFAYFQGINEVSGKIDDKTITFYITRNLSRTMFYILQFVSNFIYFFTSGAIVWSVLYLLFRIFTSQDTIRVEYFIYGFISTGVLFLTIATFGQFLGVLWSRTKTQYLGAGLIIFSWFLNSLSSLEGFPEFLNNWSFFYYLNVPKLRDEFLPDITRLSVLLIFLLISLVLGKIIFRRKDLFL
jgi:ABC-type transport system involved in multi-copper enzyme maturation permease subunit